MAIFNCFPMLDFLHKGFQYKQPLKFISKFTKICIFMKINPLQSGQQDNLRIKFPHLYSKVKSRMFKYDLVHH